MSLVLVGRGKQNCLKALSTQTIKGFSQEAGYNFKRQKKKSIAFIYTITD